MKRVSTATRLSISLVALTLSVLLAAQSLGLMPDPSEAARHGRKDLCESLAIGCSLAAQQGDAGAVRAAAQAVLERNHDVLSIGLRRTASGASAGVSGDLLVETPGHRANWTLRPGERSTTDCVQVPIFQGEKPWGNLEVCFKPLARHGVLGFFAHPVLRLLLFTSTLAFITYLLYLRKTLRYLDPSSVIPERVKAMLDTLAEGVLVLDKRERVVLANDAFAAMMGRPASELQGLAAATFPWLTEKEQEQAGGKAAGDESGGSAGEAGTGPGQKGKGLRKRLFPWAQTLGTGTPIKGAQIGLQARRGRGNDTPAGGAGPAPDSAAREGKSTEAPDLPPVRQLAVNCSPIHAEKGSTRGVLLTFDDVTEIEATNARLRDTLQMLGKSRDEIERQNKELQALATTDPLTGCLNRRSFHAEFQNRWSASERYTHSLGCVMVDVDFFKKINDRYGHSTGDQVLQHVAGILRSLARESDVVCRYGGEEFCILLPEADVTAAAQAAERYRARIEAHPCGGVKVTASVGASALNLGAASPQELLDQADKSLYAAKRGGRNRVVRWDEIQGTPAADGPAHQPATPAAAVGSPSGSPAADKSIPIAFHAVTALMSALAHRDKGTADHSRRVADLCAAAAAALMPARERFVLEVAALLHDIGKLGVPDAVLLKPGPLDEREWKIMHSHDRMGVEIISAAFGSPELTEIVRAHHARFAPEPGADRHTNLADMSLPTGRNIPLGARLLALADAYDAMISQRPYRGPRSPETAFAELRRCAGDQFDPDLVEPFIAAVTARDRNRAVARAAREARKAGRGGSAAALAAAIPPVTPTPTAIHFPAVTPATAAESATESVTHSAPPAEGHAGDGHAADGQAVPEETTLRLRLEFERLACAADARDWGALAELARQVAATAAGDGLPHLADRLRDLERSATPNGDGRGTDPDFDAVSRTVNELLELCRLPEGLRREQISPSPLYSGERAG